MSGTAGKTSASMNTPLPPRLAIPMPILFEDEGQEDMGDSSVHTRSCGILFYGLMAHFASQPGVRVFCNLNLYYSDDVPGAYVSPDVMASRTSLSFPEDVTSYRIGDDGPAPFLTAEVLSPRTAQQRDLTDKPIVYSQLGVAEYVLVDVTGNFLPQQLQIRRLQPDGTWLDSQDADGGITSQFGFRVVIDTDGQIRVVNKATGIPYARPDEAQAMAEAHREAEEARREAEEQVRQLKEELARLRQQRSDSGQA